MNKSNGFLCVTAVGERERRAVRSQHLLTLTKNLPFHSQPVEPPQLTRCFSKNDASAQFGRAQAAWDKSWSIWLFGDVLSTCLMWMVRKHKTEKRRRKCCTSNDLIPALV